MKGPVVLDASALLALLHQEPGSHLVEPVLATCVMSAVNYSEVIAKLIQRGAATDLVLDGLRALQLQVIPWDQELAEAAADLSSFAWSHGLSLGDRACLATARQRKMPVMTADRNWSVLPIKGVAVRVIR